ncbi:MAG TPA: thioredoxin family protein [Candidatus Marinimicrobia bacterium]|nr:thioredoxin family protein [Candidatus Neomarinimicrobiota bacterium]
MFLKENDKKFVREVFCRLNNPVKIINFTQTLECQYCRETRELLEEITALSDKLSLEVYNFQLDRSVAERYGVDKIPATILFSENEPHSRIKFYGIPAGYEFAALLEDIVDISNNKTDLSPEIVTDLKKVTWPVHIQVFSTPTCPYCPAAVRIAHRFALFNENIRADMIEAIEFPHLAQKYNVRGVPRSIINENIIIDGAVSEKQFLEKILSSQPTT